MVLAARVLVSFALVIGVVVSVALSLHLGPVGLSVTTAAVALYVLVSDVIMRHLPEVDAGPENMLNNPLAGDEMERRVYVGLFAATLVGAFVAETMRHVWRAIE